ncbi:Cytoskeleton protein RodZ [compost metagenome]
MEHVEVESADGTTQIHPLDEPEDQAVSESEKGEETVLSLDQGQPDADPAATPAPADVVAPSPAAAATEPSVAPVALAPVVAAPAVPVAVAPVAAVAPAGAAAPVTPPADTAPVAGAGKVRMHFVADCWTQVTDGNGKVLFSGLKRKGDNLDLSGKPPFSLRLGFARGVQVSYNGQAVDVAPFTSGETARLKLGQ